jgi:uncharacterized membrane protein YhhN
MVAFVLAALALLSAGLTVFLDAKGRRRPFLFFKPLTMVLVISVALVTEATGPSGYKAFILAGLGCSLAGDVFLMFPERWFRPGLGSFLAAHICYIMAFKPGPGRPVSMVILLSFVIYGLLMFRTLAPSLGGLKLPVLVYTAAITVMAWLAADRFVRLGGEKTLLAFSGAVLFLISDSVLAYDRFARTFSRAQIIVLGTYFPAQLLIALSV